MMILKNPSHTVVAPSTGFPTPSVTDNFNRANAGTLGANWSRFWSGDNDMGIISNTARTAINDYSDNYYNVAQYQNCDAAITIPTLSASSREIYLAARLQSPGTASLSGYNILLTNAATDTIALQRINSEVITTLNTWNQNIAAGNKIGMRISGTGSTVTIEIYIDIGAGWVLFQTETDSSADRITATGYGGIGTNSTTTRLDDFIIGNS